MTFIQAMVLGIVQGLTEFLPISSSGHLVLVPHLLGWEFVQEEAFIFNVLVQWGTLLALIVYFWSELLAIGRDMLLSFSPDSGQKTRSRLGWLLIVATIPAVVIGWLIKGNVESAFTSISATGISLFGTAALLSLAEVISKQTKRMENVQVREALVIGVFQVLSLFPGLSRSGATISGGMMVNLKRKSAARFTFLMAVPVMIAAGTLALLDLRKLSNGSDLLAPLAIGFSTSALAGFITIRWLLKFLENRSLYPFAIYCALIGFIALISS